MGRLVLTLIVLLGTYHSERAMTPPGLVLGLQSAGDASVRPALPAVTVAHGHGLRWYILPDRPTEDPAGWRLPPGVVLALTHAEAAGAQTIYAFGENPIAGAVGMPGFRRLSAGGFAWYESTGAGFDDWSALRDLPPRTIVGLKHAVRHAAKRLRWNGRTFDAADPSAAPPAGFRRVAGPDLHRPTGADFFWFEKLDELRGD